MRRSCSFVLSLALIALAHLAAVAQDLKLPLKDGSVRFAVIGDSGTGGGGQQQIAEQIAASHKQFPFEFVLMLGDNLYGSEDPDDCE